jgi:hypothetical protein
MNAPVRISGVAAENAGAIGKAVAAAVQESANSLLARLKQG